MSSKYIIMSCAAKSLRHKALAGLAERGRPAPAKDPTSGTQQHRAIEGHWETHSPRARSIMRPSPWWGICTPYTTGPILLGWGRGPANRPFRDPKWGLFPHGTHPTVPMGAAKGPHFTWPQRSPGGVRADLPYPWCLRAPPPVQTAGAEPAPREAAAGVAAPLLLVPPGCTYRRARGEGGAAPAMQAARRPRAEPGA